MLVPVSGFRRLGFAIAVATCAATLILAQTPTQTPQQYPPQQTPQQTPQQYPPDAYPGGRLPGGIPVPRIPWPKRNPKEGDKEESRKKGKENAKFRPFDGTLRGLSARELLLEHDGGVLRFRLLPKTRFVDPKDEPVRDSLLQPGDQLTIEVDADDPETAVRVVYTRAGTAEERQSAAKPVAPGEIRAPELGGPVVAGAPSRRDEASEPPPPSLSKTPVKSRDESAPRRAAGEPASLPPDQQIIEDARTAAQSFARDLPDFVVEQVTNRSYSSVNPPDWRVRDVVTAELTFAGGREHYGNVRVNGNPTDQPPEKSGAWSTGEFVTTLQHLFDSGNAAFVRIRDGRASARPAYVFEYTVDAEHSNWTIVAQDGRRHRAAFRGQIWIDKDSRRTLRIEQIAERIPDSFPLAEAETTIEYAFVPIDAGTYLLPVQSETQACQRGGGGCSRNTLIFRNYRKFSAESKISF